MRGHPGSQVHRPPEVVAALEDDRAGADAGVDRGQAEGRALADHLEGGADGADGFVEVEHHAVAEPLHRLATVSG